jgi:putative oxidoreductase
MKILSGTNTGLLSLGLLLLRLMTGVIFFVAGAGKVLGWFGGMGYKATLEVFDKYMGISAFWAGVSSYAEFIGGILLILGLFTRPAALVLVINMIVAVYMVGFKKFFFVNEGGAAFAFTVLINSFVILLAGPMRISVDALLDRNRRKNNSTNSFK